MKKYVIINGKKLYIANVVFVWVDILLEFVPFCFTVKASCKPCTSTIPRDIIKFFHHFITSIFVFITFPKLSSF